MDEKRFAELEKQVLLIAAIQVSVITAVEEVKRDLAVLRNTITAEPAIEERTVN
ncbi:MAG: hypothetical protein JXP48_13165 [Acidobacteria bacterium]|nr:hypothetical protein [Acidobacteriota bacterium]